MNSRLVLLCFLIILSGDIFAQFPYRESFRGATAPGLRFGGEPTAFLTAAPGTGSNGGSLDPEGDGYLRMTNNSTNQKGFVYNQARFPSSQGLTVEFEYYTYGGSNADGIAVFLFDGDLNINNFNIGGFGGSLGYAPFVSNGVNAAGVSGGYLAIALDEYGNFSNPIEGRNGGISGLRPGSVTLRGRHEDNYEYITSQRVADFGFPLTDGIGRSPDPSMSGYRKVNMTLAPNTNGGYNITVKITKGGNPQVTQTIIDSYYYSKQAPPFLRYGISSSTGDFVNYHEIRNVSIDAYDPLRFKKPVAKNDTISVCSGTTATIDVALNDSSTNASGYINRETIDLDTARAGIQTSYAVPGFGTFSLNNVRSVVFTPSSSFSGQVKAFYTVQDNFGEISSPTPIVVNYTPLPAAPNAGPDNSVTFRGSNNNRYTLQGGAQTGFSGTWTQISGPAYASFSNNTLPNAVIGDLKGGTYVFRWTLRSSAGCSLYDDVSLFFNNAPVAVTDTASTAHGTPVTIDVVKNDTDPDDQDYADKATVTIKSAPGHGTVTVNPLTGAVTYTPDPNYTGKDSFSYSVKDKYGVESDPVTVVVNVGGVPAKIGLAKKLDNISANDDGSFNIRYIFTLKNYGEYAVRSLALTDNLSSTFPGAVISVSSSRAQGTIYTDNSYNGTSQANLLSNTSYLEGMATASVTLEIVVKPSRLGDTFYNTANVNGFSEPGRAPLSDVSTDGMLPDPEGDGDISTDVPTPAVLTSQQLRIPDGFSPNGDGINDFFVIENAGAREVNLEVYNRWGNRVYRSADYKNNWNGKCTEGIHIGDDLPVGTYYYIIKMGTFKKAGYITLNR